MMGTIQWFGIPNILHVEIPLQALCFLPNNWIPNAWFYYTWWCLKCIYHSHMRTTFPAYPTPLRLMAAITISKEHNTRWFKYDRDCFVYCLHIISLGNIWTTLNNLSLRNFLHAPATSSHLGPSIFLSSACLNELTHSSLGITVQVSHSYKSTVTDVWI